MNIHMSHLEVQNYTRLEIQQLLLIANPSVYSLLNVIILKTNRRCQMADMRKNDIDGINWLDNLQIAILGAVSRKKEDAIVSCLYRG